MKNKPASIKYLIFFIVATFFLILSALLLKIFDLYSNSSFKSNSFSVLYLSNESKIISVNDSEKSVSYISIGDVREVVKGKNPFVTSIALGFPINAIINDNDSSYNLEFNDFISYKNEFRLIFNFKSKMVNMNEVDLHKIFSIARDASKDNINQFQLNIMDENSSNNEIDTVFLDRKIRESTNSVEVINGTGINGLANEVANILSQKGYNVVSLQTVNASFDENSYIGYSMKSTPYTDYLDHLTSFKKVDRTYTKAADVTIYLGADLTAQFNN